MLGVDPFPTPAKLAGKKTCRSSPPSHPDFSQGGFCLFNPHSIHRILPHRFCPEPPILGTHSISPPSALSHARSPPHRRHFQDPDCGTTPSPVPAPAMPTPLSSGQVIHRDTPPSCIRLILLMLFDMIEDMEQHQKAEQHTMTGRHYKVVSQWLERLGLIVVGSLVVQKIVSGAGFSDPVVILGVVVSFALYAFAYNLLLKS